MADNTHIKRYEHGTRVGVHKSEDLHTHFTISDTPADAGDFLASLEGSDFTGYNPLDSSADFNWIGRKDLKGDSSVKTRRDIASRLGDYVENDHKAISKTRDKMSDLVDSIDLSMLKRKLTWSDTRGRVNASRLLNGDSTFRRTIRKSMAPVEAVALVVPTGANCGTDADVIFARTAVALAAADLLSNAGFAVEVWAYAYSRGCLNDSPDDTQNTLAAVRIKDADEGLNEAIAASAGSAWFFRTGLFGMWAHHGRACTSLGQAIDLSPEQGREVAACIGLDKAHVMRTGTGADTVKEAIRAGIEDVKQALAKWTGESE
tara:strand:+ start:196 stop:1149 length:954 start_codon:yes stop_codon:yes gene_type:complete